MQHIEQHFSGSDTVRDVVIGMADGLTVPFALAAGISGALTSSHIVVTAGLAEIAAGSIAMGLGGYLAARSDAEHFFNERRRAEQEIATRRSLLIEIPNYRTMTTGGRTTYRFMHDDYRRSYDDLLMNFMSCVPVPSAFRNKTSGGIEESDSGGQGKNSFHVQFASHTGVRLSAGRGLLYGV